MDFEKQKKRQTLKVIVSEVIMVFAVALTVVILALAVSGYWLNSDFKVERQGMLQISSVPTGANIEIDGDSTWLQRTNVSKVLPNGEHNIVLSKDGYDTWNKTINIQEGLLYRIHYPRLFLKERTKEKLLDVAGTIFATSSPDHTKMILANNTTNWNLVNLNTNNPELKPLDISKFFSSTSIADGASAGLFTGEIVDVKWDYDGTHALFKVKNHEEIEWVLIDVNNVSQSINLSKEFGVSFSQIEILDNSSNTLLAIRNNNLHKINVPGKSISSVLIDDILFFNHFSNEIVFSAQDKTNNNYYVGSLKLGDDKIIEYEETNKPARVLFSKFYDDKYITTLIDNQISLYKKDNFELISTFELSFEPDEIEVGHNGEFILAYKDNRIATLDMEILGVLEWSTEGETFGLIDNDMIYTVSDNKLIVYDFDGLNRRVISDNVSSRFPVLITEDKWLYYFDNDILMREWLIPR